MARTGSVIRYALASRHSLAYTAETGPFENQINRLEAARLFSLSGSSHIKMRACFWLFHSFSLKCTVLCIQRCAIPMPLQFHGKSHLIFNTRRILVSIVCYDPYIFLYSLNKNSKKFLLLSPCYLIMLSKFFRDIAESGFLFINSAVRYNLIFNAFLI